MAYNEYQKMHYFALYGKPKAEKKVVEVKAKPTKPKKAQLYNLTYRGNIIIRNAPYAACEVKKRVLNASYPTNFGMMHFKIVKVKQICVGSV